MPIADTDIMLHSAIKEISSAADSLDVSATLLGRADEVIE